METLKLLEQRIEQLLDLIKELKAGNARLTEENARLTENLETLESSVLKETASIEELNQEKALTKRVVDDLIRNIDSLVEHENR